MKWVVTRIKNSDKYFLLRIDLDLKICYWSKDPKNSIRFTKYVYAREFMQDFIGDILPDDWEIETVYGGFGAIIA